MDGFRDAVGKGLFLDAPPLSDASWILGVAGSVAGIASQLLSVWRDMHEKVSLTFCHPGTVHAYS